DLRAGLRVVEQREEELLDVCEVGPVLLYEKSLVGVVRASDRLQESVVRSVELGRFDELLGDLVEVAPGTFDRSPLGRPSSEVVALFVGRTDDLAEVFEEEKELGEVVEYLVAVPQWSEVPV